MLQNQNVPICAENFLIGSSRNCNFSLKDHAVSGTLCKIKHTQVYLELVCDYFMARFCFCRVGMKLGLYRHVFVTF